MKKLIYLILFCSNIFYGQLIYAPVSHVGFYMNSEINSEEKKLTVPQGKIWVVTYARGIRVKKPNSNFEQQIDDVNYTTNAKLYLGQGFQIYFSSSYDEYHFNYIEYDISQTLSNATPKMDNRPTLFPNPTNSMLSLNSDKNYKIQVFDLNGRKLMEQNGNSLNMEHLSNATYVVKAMDVDTKEMLSYKVVKE
jgi:hypothetical protein